MVELKLAITMTFKMDIKGRLLVSLERGRDLRENLLIMAF